MLLRKHLLIGVLTSLAFISCGPNNSGSRIKPKDTVSNVAIRVVRADFTKKLPHQTEMITDLTQTLTPDQLKSLDPIWKNYYSETKRGIVTMVLDSGRIDEKDFPEFAQAIYDGGPIPEKPNNVYIIISPGLKRAALFVGTSLKQYLPHKDMESMISTITHSFTVPDLYTTIKKGQTEVISRIKQNGG